MVTKINKSEMYRNCKLDCEDTDAEKVLTQISNTNNQLIPDKFQAWIISILMNEPPQTMQSKKQLNLLYRSKTKDTDEMILGELCGKVWAHSLKLATMTNLGILHLFMRLLLWQNTCRLLPIET